MNRYYPHTIIAQEGWPFILGGLVLSILVSFLCGWWSAPFWVFVLFSLQFFRDPARDIPDTPDAILCPADGRVVVVEKSTDPYRQTEALKISVFMNVFNVHSQRSPANGLVTDVQYNAGKFLNAALDKASTENERNAVLMTTQTGHHITFVQVAGLVARRVLCYIKPKENMVRGERYGFIRFGSRVDVYLPADAVANVAIGDKVRASETILAFLTKNTSENSPEEKNNAPVHHVTENSKTVAENRLKADIEAKEQARLQAEAEEKARAEEQARLQAEAEEKARAEEQARLQAEAEEKARAEEQARLQAEAEEKARAEEQARLQAEAEEKARAEEQARLQAEAEEKARAEEQARLQAEAEEKARAEEQARLQAEAEEAQKLEEERLRLADEAARAEEQARANAEAAARAFAQAEEERAQLVQQAQAAAIEQHQEEQEEPEHIAPTASEESYHRAEEEALAEIAAREPIVRREVFASVPEPWQTIEPSEIIIKTEIKDKK